MDQNPSNIVTFILPHIYSDYWNLCSSPMRFCQIWSITMNPYNVIPWFLLLYTPRKIRWQWNIHHLKMFLLNMGSFQCDVSFQGCIRWFPARYNCVYWFCWDLLHKSCMFIYWSVLLWKLTWNPECHHIDKGKQNDSKPSISGSQFVMFQPHLLEL